MKMNTKRLRTILIILIMVNIIGLFVIISVINKENKAEETNTNNVYTGDMTSDGEVREGFVNVSSLYKNYKGSIAKSEIASKIETIVTQYFPIMQAKVIDAKIDTATYFNENKAAIKNRFGITTAEDFDKLIGEIGKINCELDDYKSYELLEDSFRVDGNYTKCTLVYKYPNGQEIKLDFFIINEESETEVKYKVMSKN